MNRFSITLKIWLSIDVFVLGFVFTVVLGQTQGVATETILRSTAGELFPAAQSSQEAEASFQKMVKGFGDAVMVQDASALERAAEDGRRAAQELTRVAAVESLPPERRAEARDAARSLTAFLSEAQPTYAAVLANPAAMTADTQERMRALAARTDTLKASMSGVKDRCSGDLKGALTRVAASSRSQRRWSLGLFAGTLLLAGVIVSLTIRKSITGPITAVIRGVEQATSRAMEASSRMSKSGRQVADDATEQAACIEETSASLEEISATSRENASSAGQADRLMQDALETMNKARTAMNDLTSSMDTIANSSQQVSAVLKSIDEIAFNTNILALNAAVEAARAGQAGAGFSVVADEVRSLARRAAEAARRSAEIVEKTIQDVGAGVALVALAHGAFEEVSATIANGSKVVSQIAASSDEQARGVSHVGTAISRIEKVTQNNVTNAHETADSASAMAQELERTREHLDALVSVVGLRQA